MINHIIVKQITHLVWKLVFILIEAEYIDIEL